MVASPGCQERWSAGLPAPCDVNTWEVAFLVRPHAVMGLGGSHFPEHRTAEGPMPGRPAYPSSAILLHQVRGLVSRLANHRVVDSCHCEFRSLVPLAVRSEPAYGLVPGVIRILSRVPRSSRALTRVVLSVWLPWFGSQGAAHLLHLKGLLGARRASAGGGPVGHPAVDLLKVARWARRK